MAFISDISFAEILIIGAVALMVFGRQLPEVAVRAAKQFVKLRRQLAEVWRQTGLEEELGKVRRELEEEERQIAMRTSAWRHPTRGIQERIREGVREVGTETPARPEPGAEDAPQAHGAPSDDEGKASA